MVSLTASPLGTIMLSGAGGIEVLTPGSASWQAANVKNAPTGGFSYIGMTSNDQGVALPADMGLHKIWMTFDGGQNWAARTPITPGN